MSVATLDATAEGHAGGSAAIFELGKEIGEGDSGRRRRRRGRFREKEER